MNSLMSKALRGNPALESESQADDHPDNLSFSAAADGLLEGDAELGAVLQA